MGIVDGELLLNGQFLVETLKKLWKQIVVLIAQP